MRPPSRLKLSGRERRFVASARAEAWRRFLGQTSLSAPKRKAGSSWRPRRRHHPRQVRDSSRPPQRDAYLVGRAAPRPRRSRHPIIRRRIRGQRGVRPPLKLFPLSPVAIRLQTGFLHCDVGADYFPFHRVKGFVRHRLNPLTSGNSKACPIAFCPAVILRRADCARKPKPPARSGLGADAALPDVLMALASCERYGRNRP